jgi:hypothetical protein
MVRKRTHRACVDVSLRLLDGDRAFAIRVLRPEMRQVDTMMTPPSRRGRDSAIVVRLVAAAARGPILMEDFLEHY